MHVEAIPLEVAGHDRGQRPLVAITSARRRTRPAPPSAASGCPLPLPLLSSIPMKRPCHHWYQTAPVCPLTDSITLIQRFFNVWKV